MPTWTEAAREAIANGRVDDPFLDTIHVSHPDTAQELFFVRDMQDQTFTLEDLSQQLFKRAGFNVNVPVVASEGLQELAITIDNIDLQVTDFIQSVKNSKEAVKLIYRQYQLSNPTEPTRKALTLFLTDFKITVDTVISKATIQDIINTPLLSVKYTQETHPGLR